MDFWAELWREAGGTGGVLLVGGALLVSLLVRLVEPEEARRFRGSVILVGLYLLLLPASALLRLESQPAHEQVRLVLEVFKAIIVIGVAGSLLFAVALPRLRLDAPRILRDVIVAGASIVAAFFVASQAGFNVSGLVATSTVLTAVIGLSLQDTLGNMMAGLALQLDRSVHVGDWVKVGDVSGRVMQIRWRSTSVETRNWETLVVPNSLLVRNPFLVVGRRTGQPVLWRRSVHFNVDYRYPPPEIIGAVEEVLSAASIVNVATDPPPHCVLLDFTESYGRYAARYWLSDFALDDPTDSVVRTRVYLALKRAGIPLSIPAQAVFLTQNSEERDAAKVEEDQRRRLEALGQVEFFNHLSDADRSRLAAGLRYTPFARGEVVTRQGAEAHWLYLITKGEAVVSVHGDGGLDREVARLRGGQFFGEMSLLTGASRTATVIANTDLQCFRLDKDVFQAVLQDEPRLAEKVAEMLAQRTVGLEAARHQLDEEAKRRSLNQAKNDMLVRIRRFFGLGEGGAPSSSPRGGTGA